MALLIFINFYFVTALAMTADIYSSGWTINRQVHNLLPFVSKAVLQNVFKKPTQIIIKLCFLAFYCFRNRNNVLKLINLLKEHFYVECDWDGYSYEVIKKIMKVNKKNQFVLAFLSHFLSKTMTKLETFVYRLGALSLKG